MPDRFVTTGSYPTRPGNAVRLLLDGEAAFRRVCEAIEAAEQRVWATITFMWPSFRMPDGRGSALEVLGRAAERGVDVRLIFWRPDDETAALRRNAFWGAPEHVEALERLGPGVSIRWDRAQPGFCQHQKTWLVDAGGAGCVGFLGGLNLNPNSLVAPGHRGRALDSGVQNHDVYIELAGPATADVHHNFVQRWNEASEREAADGRWGGGAGASLGFPSRLPPEQGSATVQVQRTLHAGRYRDAAAAVGGRRFEVANGERTIFEQYLAAIGSARRSIYLEHQALDVPEVVAALHGALGRGVEVVAVLPVAPERGPAPEVLEAFAALGACANFTLAGIAGLGADGLRKPVWVHSKLMLVDDAWATVGSANLHRWSMFGNGELNAAILSADAVRAFRVALLGEHLASDTSGLDDVAALRLFGRVARENRERRQRGEHDWQGLAVALDAATYGREGSPGW